MIGPLICRTYWGIVDTKLSKVIAFSPRQKGFVHEIACFNNIHILNETLKAGKSKNGLVAIQRHVAKAFDTVPHKAVDATLERLRLPKCKGVHYEFMYEFEYDYRVRRIEITGLT